MTQIESIIESMREIAGINTEQAYQVLAIYKEAKAYKVTAHDGIRFAHGGFMDREVILRALAQAE